MKWVLDYICKKLLNLGVEELEDLIDKLTNGHASVSCVCAGMGMCENGNGCTEGGPGEDEPCNENQDDPIPPGLIPDGVSVEKARRCWEKHRKIRNKIIRDSVMLKCLRDLNDLENPFRQR
jgi:hypothetical protein